VQVGSFIFMLTLFDAYRDRNFDFDKGNNHFCLV